MSTSNIKGLRLRYGNAVAILHAVDIDADTRLIVFGDPEMGGYEWGIERKGKVEQHSDVGYGNLPAALRDGLMTAWPPADDGLTPHAASEKGTSRADVIEEVAKHVEASPLTYFGPDPGGIKDLRYLIVAAIRDMKGKP